MFNKLVAIAALSVLSVQAIYIAEPSDVTQCETMKLTFSGTPPFTVSVWPGCDEDSTSTDALAQYHSNSTSVYWKPNVAQGKSVMFGVTDKTGDYDWTNDFTIGNSDDASCVGVSPSFSSTDGSTPTTASTSATETGGVGNAGGLQATTTYSDTASSTPATAGGSLGGALSNFAPRVEIAAVAVLGSSLAALLF